MLVVVGLEPEGVLKDEMVVAIAHLCRKARPHLPKHLVQTSNKDRGLLLVITLAVLLRIVLNQALPNLTNNPSHSAL
jgi:hypothetical protein